MNRDIQAVAERVKKLSPEDQQELALSLLHSMLPYQLRLSVAAEGSSASPELKKLSEEFMQYMRDLRDALLG